MSLEDRIAVMEAKDEIRELTAKYCHGVVDGDAEAIVALFCGDGTFAIRGASYTGTEQLLGMYTDAVGARTHKPFIQNHVIEFADGTPASGKATGRCSVEIRVFQDGEAKTGAGHYLDEYRVEDGRWKFFDRRYHPYHMAPWATGWTK